MALANRKPAAQLRGHDKPRIAPPTPARADIAGFRETAESMGITLMPWQETAARFLTATAADGRHLYPEVAIVVARQQGKTTLMKPLIVAALRAGKKVMHIAQTRELPREMFGVIADALAKEPELFPKRRGKIIWPRYGSGQEEIVLLNGGRYRIAAASSGGARGWSNDIVIVDELREMESFDIINAVEPTLVMSPDPQMIYLSNAGTDASVVLNAVRDRADKDTNLAYLEWSAKAERRQDDREGWAEANPALGYFPSVLDSLEKAYQRHSLGGTIATFETEHLCRWVVTMRPRLVHEEAWAGCAGAVGKPTRASMAVSMAPDGSRASAVLAWPEGDDKIALQVLVEATGDPIDPVRFGTDMRYRAARLGVTQIGFDPITDAELAKYFKKPKPIAGQLYANASARFVSAVEGREIRWQDADAITEDLAWTARKENDDKRTFEAVRADDERPITAVLAAIRAVWLASGPRPTAPRIY